MPSVYLDTASGNLIINFWTQYPIFPYILLITILNAYPISSCTYYILLILPLNNYLEPQIKHILQLI